MTRFGYAALGCYAIHATFHLLHGRPEDLLWMCHIGAAIVGIGLLLSSPGINAAGTLFLCMGTPLWIMDLFRGMVFTPTSCFTHIGGLAIGLYGVRCLGMPRGIWWKTVAGLAALIAVSRLVTPAHANVNVAFAIHPGFDSFFPGHLVYLMTMMVMAAAYFFIVEYGLCRWFVPEPAPKEAP